MAAPQPSPDPRDGGRPVSATPAGGGPPSPPRRRRSTASDGPPDRPGDFTPDELRFTPQRATRWFSPGVLTQSGLKVGVTSVFGSFLDKRELQSSPPADRRPPRPGSPHHRPLVRLRGRHRRRLRGHRHGGPPRGPAVAGRSTGSTTRFPGADSWCSAATRCTRRPAPRATRTGSRDRGGRRCRGPHPSIPTTPPTRYLYAVPGNHDWYDGLTGFLRMFGQGRWIGGWRTRQTRSYFAVQLPHRWWLWGVDIQSDALVDEPQLDYFEWVADEHCQAGDRIILATPVPTWTQLERQPEAYRNLAYFEKAILAPARARPAADPRRRPAPLRPLRAGRRRARSAPRRRSPPVAAARSSTRPTTCRPRRPSSVNPDDPATCRRTSWPTRATPTASRSRLLSLFALTLPVRNPSFMVVPALASLTLLWTVQFGLRSLERPGVRFADVAGTWGWTDALGGVFRNSLSLLMVLVLFGGLFAFARTPPWVRQSHRPLRGRRRRWPPCTWPSSWPPSPASAWPPSPSPTSCPTGAGRSP